MYCTIAAVGHRNLFAQCIQLRLCESLYKVVYSSSYYKDANVNRTKLFHSLIPRTKNNLFVKFCNLCNSLVERVCVVASTNLSLCIHYEGFKIHLCEIADDATL